MSMNPFHEGERRIQQRAGEVQEADRNSPMIAAHISSGAIPFLHSQSLLVVAVFHEDRMWCLPMVGEAGWLSATSDSVSLHLDQAAIPIDPRILNAAKGGDRVGALALDFASRRRLRINGRLKSVSDNLMILAVEEAYANCPKYITKRSLGWSEEPSSVHSATGERLTREQREALEATDIFFIATQHPGRGLDASHRGGDPGFVANPSDRTISFPDYAGNSLFNTLGNLEIDQRIGVLLPNFHRGKSLAITGIAKVRFEDEGHARWITVAVESWTEVNLPAAEATSELSPFQSLGLR